jgi:uncharacterized protein YcfJ
MSSRRLSAVIALFLFGSVAVSAGDRTLQLKWNQLAPLLTGEKVVVHLEGGGRVNGRVAAVQPEGLVLKGHDQKVARNSIRELRLMHMRARGRIIGTVTGLLGGLAIAGGIASTHLFSGGNGVNVAIVAAAVGLPVAGYFIGKASDRQETLIQILPD